MRKKLIALIKHPKKEKEKKKELKWTSALLRNETREYSTTMFNLYDSYQ